MKMTKKKVFLGSLVGTVASFLITGPKMLTFWCGEGNYTCWDKFEIYGYVLLIFLPLLLLLSLITYFLREEVFRVWLRFAYWWIPLSLFFTYLASGSSGGGWGLSNPFTPEIVSMTFSLLFAIISIILIAVKSWKLRKLDKSLG